MAMLTKIVIGWLVTIPLAMLVSVVIFELMAPLYEGASDSVCSHDHGST